MKISDITATVERTVQSNLNNPDSPVVLYFEGPPGIGKTAAVVQAVANIAERYESGASAHLRERYGSDSFAFNGDIRPVHMESFDVRGAPRVDPVTQRMDWATPEYWAAMSTGAGVLFLDEFGQGVPSTQAAFAQPIYDRRVGDVAIGDGWTFVLAGNASHHKAGSHELLTHIADRVTRIEAEADFDGFMRFANRQAFEPMVMAFLRWRPALFAPPFNPKARVNATPRSWERVHRNIRAGHRGAALLELIGGDIGEGPATELQAFIKQAERLPTIESILRDPTGADCPLDEVSALYAIASALSRHVTEETIGAALIYIARIPREFQVFAVRDMALQNESLLETRELIAWTANNADITL